MQQWLGDSISKLTGTGFGTRFPGGAMPAEAMPFKQISALGDDWLQQLQGESKKLQLVTAKLQRFWPRIGWKICRKHAVFDKIHSFL